MQTLLVVMQGVGAGSGHAQRLRFTCTSARSYPEQIPLAGRAARGLLRAWEGRERRILAVLQLLPVPSKEGGQAGQRRAVAHPGWMEMVPGGCPLGVGVKLAAVFV